MSVRRAAWVTGLGVVSPVGIGVEEFWSASIEGRSGTRLLDFAWLEGRAFRTRVAAPVRGFDCAEWGYPTRDIRLMDRVSQFALAAARMALDDAGLRVRQLEGKSAAFAVDGVDPRRVAVVLGTAMGGLGSLEFSHTHYLRAGGAAGGQHVRFAVPMCIPNAPAAQVAIRHGFTGENKTISTACAAGTMAIGDASRLIETGAADVVVTGGTEALVTDHDGMGLMGFDILHCLSTQEGEPERQSRPFHARRDGFVLGEGAGVLILESEEHARARGARPLAEIASYAAACDAYSMVQPHPDGTIVTRLLEDAIRAAGVTPREVDWVNAHGTATPVGDRIEAAAIRAAFGRSADDVLVSATKSITGHAIAASGAFEAIQTVLAMSRSIIPPTANLDEICPDCVLNHVLEPARRQVRVALSPSYAFGGHDAAIVFRAA